MLTRRYSRSLAELQELCRKIRDEYELKLQLAEGSIQNDGALEKFVEDIKQRRNKSEINSENSNSGSGNIDTKVEQVQEREMSDEQEHQQEQQPDQHQEQQVEQQQIKQQEQVKPQGQQQPTGQLFTPEELEGIMKKAHPRINGELNLAEKVFLKMENEMYAIIEYQRLNTFTGQLSYTNMCTWTKGRH
jgi:hypothetical protein